MEKKNVEASLRTSLEIALNTKMAIFMMFNAQRIPTKKLAIQQSQLNLEQQGLDRKTD